MARLTATRDAVIPAGGGTVTVPVPKAPFRIEVRFRPGERGAIAFAPSR